MAIAKALNNSANTKAVAHKNGAQGQCPALPPRGWIRPQRLHDLATVPNVERRFDGLTFAAVGESDVCDGCRWRS